MNETLTEMLAERPDGITDAASATDVENIEKVPVSNTALELDEWTMRKGHEALKSSELVKKSLEPDIPKSAKEEFEPDNLAADFFGAAFDWEPELAKKCKNERVSRYMKNLMETAEFKELHEETAFDENASEFATAHFAKGYVALLTKEIEEEEERKAKGLPEKTDEEKDMSALLAAGGALSEAKSDVSEYKEAIESLGGMGGDGSDGFSTIEQKRLAEVFRRVKDSSVLISICNLAGKYRRLAQSLQRSKATHGHDEMVGIDLGSDVSRLLTSELTMIAAGGEIEELALARLVEGSSMIRHHQSIEKDGKGPIVLVVDESGSMMGQNVEEAKALALALYWIARHQKRWCLLVGYSGSCEPNYLTLPPKENKQSELIEWLVHFYSGGSNRDVPLVELPRDWPKLEVPEGQVDVVSITDACCSISKKIASDFNRWRDEQQVRYTTIVVGGSKAGDLEYVSDRCVEVADLDIEQEIVKDVLSV